MPSPTPHAGSGSGSVDARLLKEEHDWLVSISRDPANSSPKFRLPDLIGACVTIVFEQDDPLDVIFHILHSTVILRGSDAARRQERIFEGDFTSLQEIQRSPANRYPNPCFSLDQIVSACVAYVRTQGVEARDLFDRARANTARRALPPHGSAEVGGV